MFVNKIYFESLTGHHVLRIIYYSTANLFTCRSAAGGVGHLLAYKNL